MIGFWGAALIAAWGGNSGTPQATLPALSVQGIARTHILCLLVDPTGPRPAAERALCEQVRRIAAIGAPVPVDVVRFGDPSIIEPDALGVLVHVAIDRTGKRPLAILSIRPHRSRPNQGVLFGATPAAVPLGTEGSIPDAAIRAALDQVLPWRMRAPR